MFLVPAYGAVRRRLDGARLLQAVTVFFAVNMLGFAAAAYFGISTSFTFFVWVSIFGVMIIAQFWAFAADTFNLKSGQRLFPVIMMGANLGGLAGAKFAAVAVDALQPVGLMVVATAGARRDAVRRQARPGGGARRVARAVAGARRQAREAARRHRARDARPLPAPGRALRRAAELDQQHRRVRARGPGARAMPTRRWRRRPARSPRARSSRPSTAISSSGSRWSVSLIQLLLVARVYRWVGMQGALVVLPIVAALGYGLIVFVPIFSIIRLVKIGENSVNYSLMNTTRHALFLPVDRDAKYEGKTAIDTFFWRVGDLIQAGVVFAGLHWLDWTAAQFRAAQPGARAGVDRPGVRHRPRVPRARAEEFLQRAAGGRATDPGPDVRPGSTVPAFRARGRVPRCRSGRRAESQRAARGRPAAAAMGAVRREAPGVPRHLSERLQRGSHDRGRGERRGWHAGREYLRDAPRPPAD